MRLRANKLKACRWNVRRTLTLFSVETAWSNLELHTRSASWQNHEAVGVSIGTSWGTRQHVAARTNSKWLRCIAVVRYSWTVFGIKKIRTFTRWSAWEVRIPGPVVTRTARFAAHDRAAISAPASWSGTQTVGLSAVTDWKAAANPCVVSAGWHNLRTVPTAATVAWASASPVGLICTAGWHTEQLHVKLKATWSVAAPVGLRATAAFNSRVTTRQSAESQWNIYLKLWLQRWTRHKAFTSLIFVYTPRSPIYPNEVRGGFLSPATANQLNRKQKFKLGIK
jgi:hypothetical protein